MSSPSVPAGFVLPDDGAPLDFEAGLDAIVDGATVKGMYFNDLTQLALGSGSTLEGARRYTLFKDYPQQEFYRLARKVAAHVYPEQPIRAAIRLLGRSAYPTLAETTIGRVLFGVFGNNVEKILGISNKGYRVSMSHTRAHTVESSPQHAIVQLDDIYIYPDCYQVGVMEGVLIAAAREGQVRYEALSPTSYRYFISWD